MKKSLIEEIETLLKKVDKYVSEDGKILKPLVYSDVMNMDKNLLELLFSNSLVKEEYFTEVVGMSVFDKQKFIWLINSKEFLPDSYTRFRNKIGLTNKEEFLSNNNDVVLDFPYKDCLLEGGQDKEDQKRNEIFYNEIIASDEIRKILSPKVFSNAKRFTDKGVEENFSFTEEDNLVIKGNNLIALSSILEIYEGKVKCIYIDPPYNTKNATNNTFRYNNSFNHSTWLTFMKNRLDIAKKLLVKDEGVMIIAIDENEQAYLGVLLNEIFEDYETHLITVVHNPRGVQGTNFSYTNEFLYYVIPKGKKSIQNRKIDFDEIEYSPLRNWGSESLRTDAKNCFYPIMVKDNDIIGFGDVSDDEEHPRANETIGDVTYIYPLDIKGIERKWRYARNTVESIQHLLRVYKRKDGNLDIEFGKDFGQYKTVWTDKKFDSNAYGKQYLNKLVEDKSFTFPKSIHAVYEAIYSVVSNDPTAIVLDFFGGSGTSAEAVMKINESDKGNRKFIIIEQMEYIESITVPRIVNSSIRGTENSLVYCELLENANVLIKEVQDATDTSILKVKSMIFSDDRIIPYVTKKYLESLSATFDELSLEDRKQLLFDLIDKNKLYVDYSDINDDDYKVKDTDMLFTNSFYKGV